MSFLEVFDQHAREAASAHLPADIGDGVAVYGRMIEQFHAAMMQSDLETAEKVHDEAHRLAVKLNGGNPGIIAGDNSPGSVLARETAAEGAAVPLWGQVGSFTITVQGMPARIDMGGIFGVGLLLPSFSANVVDRTQPFLSETGYRSFMGLRSPPDPGMTTAEWAGAILEVYIKGELKGRLLPIDPRYLRKNPLPFDPPPGCEPECG